MIGQLVIEFIDVGQGDCILLKWIKDDGSKGFGLIDSVLNGKFEKNVISRFKEVKAFDFILLSHPHYDHYSGLNRVLSYCDENEIKVHEIWITFNYSQLVLRKKGISQADFIEGVVFDKYAAKQLDKFLSTIAWRKNKKQSIIHIMNERSFFNFNSKIRLSVLSPNSHNVMNEVVQSIIGNANNKDSIGNLQQNPDANGFCSCLLITADSWSALLTSDLTTKEKNRVFKTYSKELSNVKLFQIPHHGSQNGFCQESLNSLKKKQKCKAVISVGANKYGHPSKSVVEYYFNEFKSVDATSDQNYFDMITTKDRRTSFNQNIDKLKLSLLSAGNKFGPKKFGTKICTLNTSHCSIETLS